MPGEITCCVLWLKTEELTCAGKAGQGSGADGI